jgi:hypothetical protein
MSLTGAMVVALVAVNVWGLHAIKSRNFFRWSVRLFLVSLVAGSVSLFAFEVPQFAVFCTGVNFVAVAGSAAFLLMATLPNDLRPDFVEGGRDRYDRDGFDRDGYDRDGCDRDGCDRDGVPENRNKPS